MPCYKPLDAYITTGKSIHGKKNIVFKRPKIIKENIQLPCGQCIGCKLQRSIVWAARCMHEASLHPDNCFITLTYNDTNLPQDYSLKKDHFQKFLKRLRKDIAPLKIRYFMCGEYGDQSWRPHFHALIFNYDFPDKQGVKENESENQYYISEQLNKLWPLGYHIITDLTFDTAAYVARYCTKKITGDKAEAHYNRTILDWNEFTGEIEYFAEVQLEPEYATQSKRPAIGKEWFDKYKKDCYPSDFLIMEGKKVPIPKYYDKLLEREDEHLLRVQKFKRKLSAANHLEENTLERLRQKEHCKLEQTKSLTRNKQ